MNPQIFGWQHWLYLALFIALTALGIFFARKYAKTDKTKTYVLKGLAAALLGAILINRISIVFKTDVPDFTNFIPDSFCGMSSLVLSLAVLFGKRDNSVLHFVWFVAVLGGVITMVYPDFIGQNESIFYLPTISGLLHHSLSIVVVIFLFLFGHIRVTYKKWYCTPLGFACYLSVGAFIISVLGHSDAFHIFTPLLSGTPLTFWVLAPIYAVVYGGILAGFEVYYRRKTK